MFLRAFLLSLLFILAACNSGGGSSSGGSPSETIPSGPTYQVNGSVTYDFVPINSSGLNYAGTTQKPVRNAKIQARNASGNGLLANGTTDDNGNFTINIPQSASNYYINVIAQMTSPAIQIEDNTNSNAVYLVQSGNKVNSGDTNISNIRLLSGWGGSSYTGQRYSAPFALLDTIYTAHKKMVAARPSFSLPLLKVNWSADNYASNDYDPATGAIGTSHFDGSELYILGQAGSDTDEFDRHVVVHEWGHFVEAKSSRSDSVGGEHGGGDRLQMSVAFGEGWGNALSAMILDPEISYLDSYGSSQNQIGVNMNMENGTNNNPGWFSEGSVQQILFDIYDSGNSEAHDSVSLGLGPILDVLTGPQKSTPALTSIFTFISYLQDQNPSDATAIDSLLTNKSISVGPDIYGTAESNNGGNTNTLPVYRDLTVNGGAVSVTLAGGSANRYNELYNSRFFKFTSTTNKTRYTVTCSPGCYIWIYRTGTNPAELGSYTITNSGSADLTSGAGQPHAIFLTTETNSTNISASVSINSL